MSPWSVPRVSVPLWFRATVRATVMRAGDVTSHRAHAQVSRHLPPTACRLCPGRPAPLAGQSNDRLGPVTVGFRSFEPPAGRARARHASGTAVQQLSARGIADRAEFTYAPAARPAWSTTPPSRPARAGRPRSAAPNENRSNPASKSPRRVTLRAAGASPARGCDAPGDRSPPDPPCSLPGGTHPPGPPLGRAPPPLTPPPPWSGLAARSSNGEVAGHAGPRR